MSLASYRAALPRMAVFFSDTSHGGDVLSASRKRMAGFRVNVRGLHAGWGLDTCVRQRSSTLLASDSSPRLKTGAPSRQNGGAAENRTRVWPAVNHCLPSRACPTLDAHPWTGAFGEPARLVDDVHMLAGRIHRPTV